MHQKYAVVSLVFFLSLVRSLPALDSFSQEFAFTGNSLLPKNWSITGNDGAGGQSGSFELARTTSGNGKADLRRGHHGVLSDYTLSVEVDFKTILNTQTDFLFRTLGVDGDVTLKLNNFKALELRHSNYPAREYGNVLYKGTLNDLSDGDLVTLTATYTVANDRIRYTIQLNEGPVVVIYEGNGTADGQSFTGGIGDVITFRSEYGLSRFGTGSSVAVFNLNSVNLVDKVVPNP